MPLSDSETNCRLCKQACHMVNIRTRYLAQHGHTRAKMISPLVPVPVLVLVPVLGLVLVTVPVPVLVLVPVLGLGLSSCAAVGLSVTGVDGCFGRSNCFC
jgi:hypothetical protein